ncbi:unnamed protein product, partial [Didymodactylos carnosus]
KKDYLGCVVERKDCQKVGFYIYASKKSKGPFLYLDLSEYSSVEEKKHVFNCHNAWYFEITSRWNDPTEVFGAKTDYYRT